MKDQLNKTCFVIGNGRGREGIPLQKLNGVTLGCNAVYRDFWPTCLFAVDVRMMNEIERSSFPAERFWSKKARNNTLQWKAGNSGLAAVKHAIGWGFREIVILGIDLEGDDQGSVNNIYTGTENYPKEDAKMPKTKRWRDLLSTELLDATKRRPKPTITRVIHPTHSWNDESWNKACGIVSLNLEEFLKTSRYFM